MNPEDALRRYVAEVVKAIDDARRGRGELPYRYGRFIVSAVAGQIECTLKDVSEEDAVLIAGELRALGARAVVRGARRCRACGSLVPDQDHCVVCRAPLAGGAPD
jgi:hypothetical protein